MDLGLTGSVCVVTGASRGIGLETARRLAAEGARVLLVDATPRPSRPPPPTPAARRWSPTSPSPRTPSGSSRAPRRSAGSDVLVNNAGTSFARALDDLTDEDWRSQYDLHVLGPMRLMRAAAPLMAARGGGRIVNVTSSAGKRPSQTNAAYSVTKAAQLSLSRLFADAWAGHDVLVNAVAPGPVASPLWMAPGGLAEQTAAARGVSAQEAIAIQEAKVPLGRFAEPGEIADVVVFLCSARASTVTGAAWSADGGAVAIIV